MPTKYCRLNNHVLAYDQVRMIFHEKEKKQLLHTQNEITTFLQNTHDLVYSRSALYIILILSLQLLKTCTQVDIKYIFTVSS